jgi:hypothetical protein
VSRSLVSLIQMSLRVMSMDPVQLKIFIDLFYDFLLKFEQKLQAYSRGKTVDSLVINFLKLNILSIFSTPSYDTSRNHYTHRPFFFTKIFFIVQKNSSHSTFYASLAFCFDKNHG